MTSGKPKNVAGAIRLSRHHSFQMLHGSHGHFVTVRERERTKACNVYETLNKGITGHELLSGCLVSFCGMRRRQRLSATVLCLLRLNP